MSGEPKKTGWLGRLFGKGKKAEETAPADNISGLLPEDNAAAAVTPAEPAPADETAATPSHPAPGAGAAAETAAPVPPPVIAEPPVPEPAPEPIPEPPAPEPVVLPAPPVPAPAPEPPKKTGWLARIKQGLSRTTSRLTQGISDLLTKRKLDEETLEQLEELLITTDIGVATAARIVGKLGKARFNQEVSSEEVRTAFAEDIAESLKPVALPLVPDRSRRPHVVLVVGVNGSGKTTTIGKMARFYRDQGLKVTLAAGDTFRAAAVEQLKIWGDRTGCPVISRAQGADAAGLAFDALKESQERGDDLLLIDTAGRLQNKAGLMAELQKIVRVLRKQDPTAPHTVLQVLDATVGQNAHSQVEIFKDMTEVSGLVLTKLDGTARGGVLVALAEKFKLPVHFIGVGEQVDDMRPFEARAFARSLMGLED